MRIVFKVAGVLSLYEFFCVGTQDQYVLMSKLVQ